ncbi:MAG: putative signal transducing protein [Phycisphaerales bacterium JB041]
MGKHPDQTDPVTVAEVMSEFEAAIIRSTLEAEGVPSWVIGGLLTGFRAELPGRAQVVVRAVDAELAREILATVALDAELMNRDDADDPEGPGHDGEPSDEAEPAG